jgi:putative modified peptide
MNDTVLPQQLAIALLTKLSTDDGFRSRYAASPKQGLTEIGMAANDVAALPPSSTGPVQNLADKSVFQMALQQLRAHAAEVCVCYHPPTIKFKFGH